MTRYNTHLRSMAFFLYILYVPTCMVRGLIIQKAVPGQNVSLPCMVDQVNNQQTVKWWSHSRYISSEKIIIDSLGLIKTSFALPGEGANYSLFIMIPDEITIWPYLVETYECRLVSNTDGDVLQKLKIYELQIYQPECIIIHINGSISVPSCSYQNIPEVQATWLVDDSSVHSIRDCTSDVCPLNYTFNPREVNPQDIECSVEIPNRKLWRIKCSITQTHSTILPQKTEVSSQSTSPTKYIDVDNSQGTMVQTSPEGPVLSSTITTAEKEDNATQLIVIISVAALIILFLIIIILFFVRRNFKIKQNSAMKSPPTDKNVYFENDQQEDTNEIRMMEGAAQSDDINFKQSSEDSVMKENDIYQSADTNSYELSPVVNEVSVAKPGEANYPDRTNKADEEINDFVDGINMNKKNDGPTTSQTHNKVKTYDDLGYIEKENEAYQSLNG
ncbi:uncharacterized protein LOC117099805 [Anneissia japonica]|uniref:uncharacterized protein LOC117099805 n=1 Tax=Anneissia japonica TaxID=1529436 RepID=UPI001425AD07|nr:uncharacterized protein LOC117099805 [Anneissia japonica]